ncbi:MAG: uroporphyrinogen-III C-methyltransferase, partial [Pontibacterium sp.]
DLRMVPEAEKRDLPDLIKEITPETVSESWAAPLQKSWNKAVDKFNSLIVIQHRDEKVEALLSPQDTFYLQQNLHLMLEQAQLALLQRKQTAYDAALDKASAWTTKFFNPKDATTQAVVRGIEELKAINVSPSIPDISGSLASLKGYVQTMAKLKQEKGES